MPPAPISLKLRGLALMFRRRRLRLALGVSALVGLIISPAFATLSTALVMVRELPVGLAALVAFGLFEQWPARPERNCADPPEGPGRVAAREPELSAPVPADVRGASAPPASRR